MHPLIEKIAKKKGGDWIADATKNKGGLHRSLDIPEDEEIPKKDLKAKPGDSKKVKKQKELAKTLEKLGIAKPPGALSKIKAGAKKAGKYAKWGGLGLGVYLTLKALEGAKEAKQEATHRW